jgi:long-chain acyl-CoA synthetase
MPHGPDRPVAAQSTTREATTMEKRMEDILRERLGDEPSARCVYWNGAWLSRGDLANLAEESRGVLEAAGFGSGMRLASLLPNSPMVLALSLACWRLGGAFVL